MAVQMTSMYGTRSRESGAKKNEEWTRVTLSARVQNMAELATVSSDELDVSRVEEQGALDTKCESMR